MLEETENISQFINDPKKMISLTDSYLRFSNNQKVKEIIKKIDCRNLPSLIFESISLNKKKLDDIIYNKIDELSESGIIKTISFKVGYVSGKGKNPLENIMFYGSKNNNIIKFDSGKDFSLLINNKHQEQFFRIYCMDDKFKKELTDYFN
jgi:phage host-nuclease inhibitor protein Gam